MKDSQMKRRRLRGLLSGRTAAAIGAAVLLAGLPQTAAAQQPAAQAQQPAATPLPPALQAAVLTGNPQAVQQAINTLSGSNPTRAADLANQVVRAAEQMLNTNPQAAIRVAAAAVDTVKALPVQSSAPRQTESVLTTAARIFISPAAQRLPPEETSRLATATVSAANTTGNVALVGSVATQAVATAEKMLASSPAEAVALAASAVQAIQKTPVMQGAPEQSMTVVTTAARIIVQPEAQRIAPQTVASLAGSVVQVASNSAVYQASPAGAIAVMTNAYAAANSQTVVASVPSVTTTTRSLIQQAGASQSLSTSNPTNSVQVNEILSNSNPATAVVTAPTGTSTASAAATQTPAQQTANTNNDVSSQQRSSQLSTNTPPVLVITDSPFRAGSSS